MKTINVEDETWSKLVKYKYALGCKSLSDLVDKILKIVPASELKK